VAPEGVFEGESLDHRIEGASNSIIRFQIDDGGKDEAGASYQTGASLPGIALDPNAETLWVAGGSLTSFELKSDPDMKKPKTLLQGGYRDVTFVPGAKLLVLEIQVEGKVLPEKAFEIYSMDEESLKKVGVIKPEPDAYAYGFTDDGKWMLVGGSHGDKKLRSYKLEGGKITLADTLAIPNFSGKCSDDVPFGVNRFGLTQISPYHRPGS